MNKLNYFPVAAYLLFAACSAPSPKKEINTDSIKNVEVLKDDSLKAVALGAKLFKLKANYKYSISYDSLKGKKFVLSDVYIRDIFKDSTGYYIKVTSKDYYLGKSSFTLAAEKSQVDSLQSMPEKRCDVVFQLVFAKKVTQDTTFYIDEELSPMFSFKGTLFSIKKF